MAFTDVQDEFIIVGGGLAGLSAGYELVRRGHVVRILEAGRDVALETSFANGGLLTPSMSDPWNGPGVHRHLIASLTGGESPIKLHLLSLPSLMGWGIDFLLNSRPETHRAATLANFRLADYSLTAMRGLREELNLDYDALTRGTMKVFRSAAGMDGAAAVGRMLAGEGLVVDQLDRDAAVRLEPQLAEIREQVVGALHYPHDESGDAYRFCRALASRFEADGGKILLNTPVHRIAVENGRVIGVYGPEGLIRARGVIVAAGNRSAKLASALGVGLSIKPAKGYSLTFDVDASATLPRIPIVDDGLHAGVSPLGGRLRIAGTVEFAGDDRSIAPDRIANLMSVLRSIYPHLAEAVTLPEGGAWAGLRPMSSDGLPYIGASRVPGLWINSGHGHLGFTLATGSGRLLADLIEDRTPEIDPTPFRVHR